MKQDIWRAALDEALDTATVLRASELLVDMVVRCVGGRQRWRVVECLCPDVFWRMGIVRMVDETGDDNTYLFEIGGRRDEAKWVLLGHFR